uniref:Uncharacterized protein n=1 Tax=Pararge aegeria TaxID=116150 RepID=S4P7T9_9NEOP
MIIQSRRLDSTLMRERFDRCSQIGLSNDTGLTKMNKFYQAADVRVTHIILVFVRVYTISKVWSFCEQTILFQISWRILGPDYPMV